MEGRRRRPDKRRAGRRAGPPAARPLGHRAALEHRGQGKWYPGEPLPRWQIGLLWRADGEPLWSDPTPARRPVGPPVRRAGPTAGRRAALRAIVARARRAGRVLPAGLRGHPRPPARRGAAARRAAARGDVDPADQRHAAHRTPGSAVVQQLDATAGEPAGWVLPLHRLEDGSGWATTRWRFRRGRLVLLPGTSPLGLRLPLELHRLGAAAGVVRSARPSRSCRPLPAAMALLPGTPDGVEVPVEDAPHDGAVRRGARRARLRVPAAAGATRGRARAARRGRVRGRPPSAARSCIEGYPPPADPRLRSLVVTPDPGVVEVNVQPSASWPELVHVVASVDEDARLEQPGHGDVRHRRRPRRHRRRQPLDPRRGHPGGQPAAAPPRPPASAC